jgi:hypothetical protein
LIGWNHLQARSRQAVRDILFGYCKREAPCWGVSGREFSICYFCWTFIPAAVGLIEGIIYLSMSDASFEEKHG